MGSTTALLGQEIEADDSGAHAAAASPSPPASSAARPRVWDGSIYCAYPISPSRLPTSYPTSIQTSPPTPSSIHSRPSFEHLPVPHPDFADAATYGEALVSALWRGVGSGEFEREVQDLRFAECQGNLEEGEEAMWWPGPGLEIGEL